MYKKSLLSYTATVAIILSSIYSNAHAESLEASGEGQSVIGETGKSYEILHAKESGKITGENLTVTGNKDTGEGSSTSSPGSSSLESPAAVTAEGENSMITLTGDKTTIKGTDFNINLGLEAKNNGIIKITGGTVNAKEMALFSGNGGHIIVENVVLTAEDDEGLGVVVASGDKSTIELQGNTKIENAVVGLTANNDSTIKMTGGSITASGGGAAFLNSKGDANELNGVTISSHNEVPLLFGISANKSMVTLKNVTVTQAEIGIFANDSKLEVFGGEFNGKNQGVYALNGGTVILNKGEKDGATITSTDGTGLVTEGKNSTIKMTGGTVTGNQAALSATQGGHIEVEDVTLKATGDKGIAAGASNSDSIIKLGGNTTVESTFFGLGAANGGNVEMTGGTVTGNQAALSAFNSGHIEVTDVSLKTNNKGVGAQSTGPNSTIELHGNTIVDDAVIGLFAQDGGAIKMSGGSITVSTTGKSTVGANFSNNSKGNKLENVTISKKEGDTSSLLGISAIDNSQVTLKNVTVKQAKKAIFASNSEINVFGGTFETENDTVYALNGGSITLAKNGNDGTTIISTDGNGLHAEGENSIIKMTDGTVTTKNYALFAEDKAHIEVENVTLKTTGDKEGAGAIAIGDDSVIKLHGNTTVDNAIIGLLAQDNGAIKMTGGSITASKIGAYFENTESEKNKLEGVTISSGKNDAPLIAGIEADKNSTVALKDVTVTQATSAIIANDHSTITVSGGSFNTKSITIGAANGSTITLTNEAQITSSENYGLYAEESGSTITMTKGNVTGKGVTLAAENGGHITATDVTLKTTDGDGVGAGADGSDSVIKLLGNTTISDSNIGIGARNSGAISITGGSIKASLFGAYFENTKSEKNKLEGVTISSGKNDAPLIAGIAADKNSTVALKDVTVTNANTGISANDHSTITVSGGSVTAEGIALYATNGGQIDVTNVALTAEEGARANGTNSVIELHGKTTLKNASVGLSAIDGGKIASNESLTIVGREAIVAMSVAIGVWADNANSEINLNGKTTLEKVVTGLVASDGGKIFSKDITIIGADPKDNDTEERINVGVKTNDIDSRVELKGKTIIEKVNVGLSAFDGSTIKLINVPANAQNSENSKIEAKEVALLVEGGGQIDVTNVSATAGIAGLQFVVISNPDPDESDDLEKHQSNAINLTNTKLSADNGAGIFITAFSDPDITENADLSIGKVNLTNSEIHADVLLGDGIFSKEDESWNNENVNIISNGTFTLSADQSILEGRANIAKNRNVHFDLKNNTQWILKNSAHETDDDGQLIDIAQRSRSDISTLNLDNSSIIFNGPTEEHYHTLHIGSGKPDTQEVYKASGDAKIYFNIAWSDGVASADQKTDRLLIHGDVSGNTTVYIKSDSGDKNSVVNAADPSNIGGLSLIQVSGKAQENSFKLANGYTTRGRLPYKYTLTAYGPASSHGQADIAQNLFDEKNENFWDFRLHKEILETGSGSGVDTLVPQTASYLVMPNALFSTGLTDMAKQNALLANIRTSVLGKEEEKQTGF
ncbi:autotransporter outer membrane beta-barrel domain-containing protein, partial [Bartonella sp. MR110HLJHH]|uniref:autotransporter outer membrane beta-barrel domain-containing protein n=1 Tax=Bartonella sp. MR110HLJHH TaxID=3243555 RepID=UPI0035D138ED